jgi:hypothetical protein
MKLFKILGLLSLFIAADCTDGSEHAVALCALADTSGTYADQVGDVVDVLRKGVLPHMLPGDTLVVARVDDASYRKENVTTAVTLDVRPSVANAQKQQTAVALASFARAPHHARYTDIRGGILLCSDYLKETRAGNKAIIVFSDLLEELPRGSKRSLPAGELAGVRLVAMNVKHLAADNRDPAGYRARLASWDAAAKASGAPEFRVVLEPDKLVDYLDGLR